jgi:putative transposase
MQGVYQFAAGSAVHLLQSSAKRLPVLAGPDDCRMYRRVLAAACRTHRLSLHAYALMPDRVHLLVTPVCRGSIDGLLGSLRRDFHPRPRAGLGGGASQWQPETGAVALDSAEQVLACYRHIERSPLRAGLAAQPGDHPWSSYRGNAEGEHDPLLTPHRVYLALADHCREREAVYRRCVHGPAAAATLGDCAPADCDTAAGSESDFRRRLLERLAAAPAGAGRQDSRSP